MNRCRSQFQKPISLLLLVALCATSVGCMTFRKESDGEWRFSEKFNLKRAIPWKREADEPEIGQPVRMVDAWTDGVMHKPGQPSQRGFGGRIYFYEADATEPVRVAGQLVVYVFDEAHRDPLDNRPTKRYVFPPGEMDRHVSESKIGPSYSMWLPWDEVGGRRHEVSIICRFQPIDGQLVVGNMQKQQLPGVMVAENEQLPENKPTQGMSMRAAMIHSLEDNSYNQQASFEEPQPQPKPAEDGPQEQMTTTSISLPARLGR